MKLSPYEVAQAALKKAPDGKPCHLWVRPLPGPSLLVEGFSLIPPFKNKENTWVCIGKLHRRGTATKEEITALEKNITFIVENHKSFYGAT